MKVGRFPSTYRQAQTPCLPKKGESSEPLQHRLLSVYSAVYRVESGAFYQKLKPWIHQIAHPDLAGGIAGREPLEVAWDAQSDLEHSILNQLSTAMVSYDYYNFFDKKPFVDCFDDYFDGLDDYSDGFDGRCACTYILT